MRSLIIFGIAIFAISNLNAQNSVERFIEQYAEHENANNLTLQGILLQLAGNASSNKQQSKAITKLNKLSALWIEDYNPINKKAVHNLLKNLRKDHFEPLIVAREGKSNVNFMIQENGQLITGVILIIDDIDNFLLINLSGQLRFEDLGDIDFDIEGMEHFKKIPKKRA